MDHFGSPSWTSVTCAIAHSSADSSSVASDVTSVASVVSSFTMASFQASFMGFSSCCDMAPMKCIVAARTSLGQPSPSISSSPSRKPFFNRGISSNACRVDAVLMGDRGDKRTGRDCREASARRSAPQQGRDAYNRAPWYGATRGPQSPAQHEALVKLGLIRAVAFPHATGVVAFRRTV